MTGDILNFKNYHFIGIGGIGVSAIARMLSLQGKIVSGSDSAKSQITDDLKKLGIKVFIGQKAKNLDRNSEVVIYSVAVPEDNPEIVEAKKRKLICASYPQALGELSKKMFTIAISGTHGKTTTTAMVGHILKKAGLDPTVVVGSKILGENSNFIAGKSKYLVVEACEYRRSFLNLFPTVLVITNIEPDHLDYYKDIDDIKSAFEELKKKIPKDGKIITETEYKKVKADFDLLVPGQHNILDAQAAIAAAGAVGVPQEKAKKYLEDFRGTWRRLEYKGEKDGKIFYDDYAHHPTAVKVSLQALKEKNPDRELVCVFEPHQELRTKLLFNDFVKTLSLADKIFVAPIYINKEISDGSVSNKTLAEAVNKFKPAEAVENPKELSQRLQSFDQTKPACIAMFGAGNLYKWTKEILSK